MKQVNVKAIAVKFVDAPKGFNPDQSTVFDMFINELTYVHKSYNGITAYRVKVKTADFTDLYFK